MSGCVTGCVGRAAALLLLGAVVGAAWIYGPDAAREFRSEHGAASSAAAAPSPEIAAEAVNRYQEVVEGELDEGEFTAVELESILTYRLPEYLPEGIDEPSIRFRDGELILGLRMARTLLPDVPELERIMEILPDTVPVQIRGSLLPVGEREAAFMVRRIDVANVPIPRRFYARILEGLDPREREGLPAEAISVPLPPGVGSALIRNDRLVLITIR